MSVNVVQNGRRFAVERDIIQAVPVLVGRAAESMARTSMPAAVRDFAAFTGVTDADSVRATTAMAEFINIARSAAFIGDDFEAAYIRSGLASLPQASSVALYAVIGMCLMGGYFRHVRDALPDNVRAPGADAVAELLARAAHAQSASTASSRNRRADEVRAGGDTIEKDMQ